MPDYDLGRAHGTIKIDYEKSGAESAREDIEDIGEEAVRTGDKIDKSTKEAARSYRSLGTEAKRAQPGIDVDEDQFRQLIRLVQGVNKNTQTSANVLNTFSGRLRLISAGVAILIPGVAGLGVSLVALAGLAGVAAGALASLSAAAATVGVGMSGVGDAFKAAAQQAKAAGGSAGASAKAQRAAAKAIEQAKRSLADAEQNLRDVQEQSARAAVAAARQVVEAQRDLVNAQRDAVRAQQALSRARQQATRDLEDMRDALRGGALEERQAVLDLKEAQQELNRVRADPTANEDDIARAVLNYDKAVFALEQLRKENQRLTTDQAAAAAAGVDGSEQVVSAQDAVRESAESVRDAQQALADAQDNVRQVQIESARAIADAVQGVIDAQEAVREAYLDAAEAGAGAAAKLDDAMANLSPNARAFVQEVLNLRGAWDQVRRSVQDQLFAGLADDVQPLAEQWFPLLETGMGKVATGLNGIVQETLRYLATAEAQANVAQIFDNTGQSVTNLRTFVRDLLAAFLDIAAVGSDLLPAMATDASNAAANFRQFVAEARESGRLREWMQGGIDAASELWQLLKNLAGIIGTVFTALDQEGGGALNTLTAITGQVQEFLNSAEGQEALHALGKVLASIGGAVGKVFLSFLETVADLLVALEPLIVAFADAAGTYLAAAWQALGFALQPVADLLGFLGPVLGPLIAAMYAMNKVLGFAKTAWAALTVVMNANPFVLITAAVIALAYLIYTNWDSIKAFLAAAWQWIQDAAGVAWDKIRQFIIDPIVAVWNKIVAVWNTVKNFLASKFNEIKNTTAASWKAIKDAIYNALVTANNRVSEFVNSVGRFFRDLPGKIMNFLKSLPGKLMDWGGQLIEGIVRGISNFAHRIWEKLKSVVTSAWDNVLDFFGISSPAKQGIWAGEMIVEGLASGITGMASAAVAAASALAGQVTDELLTASGSMASSVALAADTSDIGGSLAAITVPLTTTGNAAAAAAGGGDGATAGRVGAIQIDNLTLQVAGNLDPTNPVAFRQTLVNLKDALRNIDKEYA